MQDLLVAMGIPAPNRPVANNHRYLAANLHPKINLKSLAGNGMHCSVVGSILLAIITDLQFKTPGDAEVS